jgi:hypothetical protein
MKRFVVLLSISFFVLVVFSSMTSAERIDVVHLKNGSIIKGTIIETIPNESIKIETADGSIFVYSMHEVTKIVKEEKKAPKTTQLRAEANRSSTVVYRANMKSPATATTLACCTGWLLPGIAQLYNEQYAKAFIFAGAGVAGWVIWNNGQRSFIQYNDEASLQTVMTGSLILTASWIISVIDANISARHIRERQRQGASLDYIPHQGLMASYNMRF